MGRALVSLDNVYENNLGMLVKLCKTVDNSFVQPDSFYNELFPKGKDNANKRATFFTQIAYYSEIPVAAIKAKLYPKKKNDLIQKGIHIETLVVLPEYRGKQIGSKLLDYVEEQCKNSHQHTVYIHIPITQEHAIEWYKKHGFEQEGENFTSKIENNDKTLECILLKKHIE